MPIAIVTGSGGLIGSESVAHFVEARLRRRRIENDMRAAFFGPEASTAPRDRAARATSYAELPLARRSTSATPTASTRVFAEHARRASSWSSTPPRSRRTTGRRRTRRPTSASTPTARSTCSRRRARTRPTRPFVFSSTNKVYGDTPEPPAARRARDAARAARRTTATTAASTRRCRSTRSTALAVRRLQGGRRPAGAGVRPLLRHADGLLPRRLPDRARTTPARSCTASSSYLMRCTVTGEPYTVFGYGGKQVRDNIHSADLVARLRGLPPRARAPAAVYNLGGGRASQLLDARGDRRCASGSPAASSTGRCATRPGSATTAGGSPTSARSSADYPDWQLRVRRRGDPARDPRRRTSSAGRAAVVKLSVVIPAHNEAGSIEPTLRGLVDRARAARASTTRSSSSTTPRTDGTGGVVARAGRAQNPRVRCLRSHYPQRLRLRGPRRPRGLRGRRRGDRDGRRLRRPARPRPLLPRCSRRATTARSARASCPARAVHDYPRVKLVDQPDRQPRHPRALPPRLQRHDQRLQGLPARGDRERPAAALATTST